jgi:hypothetical protein
VVLLQIYLIHFVTFSLKILPFILHENLYFFEATCGFSEPATLQTTTENLYKKLFDFKREK